jgi:hypothetical protein
MVTLYQTVKLQLLFMTLSVAEVHVPCAYRVLHRKTLYQNKHREGVDSPASVAVCKQFRSYSSELQ